jgi:hypothetical protein
MDNISFNYFITPIIITLVGVFSQKIQDYTIKIVTYIKDSLNSDTTYILSHLEHKTDYGSSHIVENNKEFIEAIMEFLSKNITYKKSKVVNIKHDTTLDKNTNLLGKLLNAKQSFIPNDIIEYNDMKFNLVKLNSIDNPKNCSLILKITTSKHSKDFISNFIKSCIKLYLNEREKSSGILLFINSKGTFTLYTFESSINFDNIFFKEKSIVIDLINKLNDKKISKLGIMLHGESGCGKTSTIKCIANYTGRHIISINLNTISSIDQLFDIFHNNTLSSKLDNQMFNKFVDKSKRIYILEDVDCDSNLSHKRKKSNDTNDTNNNTNNNTNSENDDNIKDEIDKLIFNHDTGRYQKDETFEYIKSNNSNKSQDLTLSNILNCLDGVIELNDVIIIMTTNHIEKIDPALIRPGRINLVLELKKLDKISMKEMITYKYNKCISDDLLTDYVLTPATLNNLMLVSETVEELESKIKDFMATI